jgi:C4-dicarboxylate transporter, DctM subunit
MSPLLIGGIGLVVLFAVLATGLPIGVAMALVGFIGYGLIAGFPAALIQLQTVPYTSVASYTLTIIPLFILMGEFAFHTGLITSAYNAAHKWFGPFRGGLALTTIAGCAGFAAVCGSGMATASTMTSIAYPEMKRYRYDSKLALGAIACGGTLGILIPPSNPMVIYAIFSEVSVGRMFMSGIFPGILMAVLMMITVLIWTRISPLAGPAGSRSTLKEKIVSIKGIWPVALLAFIVLGGIWSGIMTAMEAAGVGALVTFIIGLALRKISRQNVTSSLRATIKTSAMIFIILIGAMIFNYFIVMSGVPNQLAAFAGTLSLSPLAVLISIIIVYFFLGMLMDTMAMAVLTLPIFLPVLTSLGYDLIWFGIVFVIMGEMAMVTPPIGMNVFVISGMVKEVPMYTIFRGIVPFVGAMAVCLILIIAFPQIALFLPNTMIK